MVLVNSFNPKYVFKSCQGDLEIYYGVHYSKNDLLSDFCEKNEFNPYWIFPVKQVKNIKIAHIAGIRFTLSIKLCHGIFKMMLVFYENNVADVSTIK